MSTTNPASDSACAAAKPASESLRVAALRSYGILDTPREAAFDDITRMASLICQTPISVVNLIDEDRQWFKSEIGLGVRETPLDVSICAHAILQPDVLVVPDTTLDSRFSSNPLVTGEPYLRFYAGALLSTPEGLPLGTVCVLDQKPRQLTPDQRGALRALARQVMAQLELRRALRLAGEANHYRSRLLAIAGHDLRSPLRAVSYAIERVRPEVSESGAARLDSASAMLSRIGDEFNQLVAASHEAGQTGTPQRQTLAVADVLEHVLATWRPIAERKGLRLRAVPSRAKVHSHPVLLATIIGNLVGNAVKYTDEGKVLVGCRRRGNTLRLEVLDTGQGMPEERADHMFQAFNQADSASDGLGLGLWLVRHGVDLLGHELQVSSQPGRGTRFSLSLPLAV